MTEAEWLECDAPRPMLDQVQFRASDRKLRLFACACCRRLWHLMTDERSKGAVEMAERFAEGAATQDMLNEAAGLAAAAFDDALGTRAADLAHAAFSAAAPDDYTDPAFVAAEMAHHDAANAAATLTVPPDDDGRSLIWRTRHDSERAAQAALFRDIFGNPFRPVVLDPSWLTSTVVALASGIYEEKAFDRMPILADALQDAGCDNEDVLTHCRGPGAHVRGCWVVDLVLGKE